MAKQFKWLMVLFIPLISLTLTSCGGDDKDEPDNPSVNTGNENISIESRTEALNVFTTIYGGRYVNYGYCGVTCSKDEQEGIYVAKFIHGSLSSCNIIKFPSAKGIEQITGIPSTGWEALPNGYTYPINDECGYLLEIAKGGVLYYYRVFLKLTKNASGSVVGYSVQYQRIG